MQMTQHSFESIPFSQFSDLKPNISKYEIAGIGLLKRAIEAVCGLQLVGLTLDTI